MKKTTITAIIIISIAVLLFTTLLIVFLTSKENKQNKELYSNQEISIRVDGVEVGKVNEQKLREIETEEYKAVLKTSDMLTPVEKTYTGTEIIKVLQYFNIDLTDKSHIVATASDGLTRAYDIEKIKTENELYITYLSEGKPFYSDMGIHNDGENGGPYVIIIKSEQFSNNRLKLLVSIDLITKTE